MEIWKDIEGYDGHYSVSNLGRVRSNERFYEMPNGSLKHLPTIIMKETTSGCGYKRVKLLLNGKPKIMLVHRLVALAFIPNPNNYRCVNHKDENKQNNNVNNLEWCTHKYNSNYGTAIERCRKKCWKPIIQYTPDGKEVRRWNSIIEASQTLNVCKKGISSACRGKYHTSGGYIWKFVDKVS